MRACISLNAQVNCRLRMCFWSSGAHEYSALPHNAVSDIIYVEGKLKWTSVGDFPLTLPQEPTVYIFLSGLSGISVSTTRYTTLDYSGAHWKLLGLKKVFQNLIFFCFNPWERMDIRFINVRVIGQNAGCQPLLAWTPKNCITLHTSCH